jgi:hypothetical protein
MSSCICTHVEHDDGRGECYTSGCRCRSFTEPEPLTVDIVRRAFAVSASSPFGGQDVFEHYKDRFDRWLDAVKAESYSEGEFQGAKAESHRRD